MRYSAEIIEEVQARNDIVDVISSYVKIQKKGASHFGLCPFHAEKTPSFSVSSSKQIYYCFGCGAGGNVIDFIKRYENYSFIEALQFLAQRAGMRLPEAEYSKEDKELRDYKELLGRMNKSAALYFFRQLKTPQGEKGYRYFRERGLNDDTILRFGLGFAPKSPDDLYRHLKAEGFDDGNLKESGLVSIDEKGARDKFWNRVIFPIMDTHNKVIGFGGRVMGEGSPKYLNSQETKLFDKSRTLYGLNYAKNARKDYVLLCEGYMDVLALHQAGFGNAAASLGTAFTSLHANALKRYFKKAVLSYDSDSAGIKAALRALTLLKEAGISVRVLNMQPYKDPDECIREEGKEAFEKRIEDAKNAFLWEIDILKGSFEMKDPEMKTEFYKAIARRLCEFEEKLERENYIRAVCREHFIPYEDMKALVASTLRRDYSEFRREIAQGEREPEPEERLRERRLSDFRMRKKKEDKKEKSPRLLLAFMTEDRESFEKISAYLQPEDFKNPLHRELAELIFSLYQRGRPTPAAILSHYSEDEEKSGRVAEIFNEEELLCLGEEEKMKAIEESVFRVKQAALDEASRNAEDINELQRIMQEQAKLKRGGISIT
ncbi:MAG: DNA primase [Johnsonella sp.]|nr:DNA primase [Johnsonella sp.]